MGRDPLSGMWCPLHLGVHVHTPAHNVPTHVKRKSSDLTSSKTPALSHQANGTAFPETCLSSGLELAQGQWGESKDYPEPTYLFPAVTLSTHRFVMLSLEFDYMCQYDYVEVRDGDNSDGQIIKRFCGNERPAPIRSTGSSLHVLFHSDGSKNFDGFHAIFEEITGKDQGDTCRI